MVGVGADSDMMAVWRVVVTLIDGASDDGRCAEAETNTDIERPDDRE
jgi:hypothetical protein